MPMEIKRSVLVKLIEIQKIILCSTQVQVYLYQSWGFRIQEQTLVSGANVPSTK